MPFAETPLNRDHKPPASRESAPPPVVNPRRRFTLRSIFIATTALAIVCAVVAQVPPADLLRAIKYSPVLVLFTVLLALVPLTIANLVCVGVACIRSTKNATADDRSRLHVLLPHRLLWQAGTAEPPSWKSSVTIAVTCTLITVLLWPLLRELGLAIAQMVARNVAAGMPTLEEIPKLMVTPAFLWRLSRWEMFSISRWWYVFSLLMIAWFLISWPWRDRFQLEPISATVRRLLAFAPWLVVIEVAFLVGVWTLTAQVVPEPSTGFVEGIFSWNLWHWDCWKGRVWIGRGLVPTFIIGSLFFMTVLHWRWPAAIAAAACLVPLALMLSVAWMVLYSHGLG